jgi:hypothetical protein
MRCRQASPRHSIMPIYIFIATNNTRGKTVPAYFTTINALTKKVKSIILNYCLCEG